MMRGPLLAPAALAFLSLLVLPPPGPVSPANGARAGGTGAAGLPWAVSAPEEAGISSASLADMLERIERDDIQLHSIVLVKDGMLVLEAYVYPYDRETLHNVKSVSKSVISALVGIALEEGVIAGLDGTVQSYLPQYITGDMDPRKREIRLRHLLAMTSGLDLDENGPISGRIFGTLDWLRATYRMPMRDDPGARFLYSTPLTHTMSVILTEESGMSLEEYGRARLFEPLGFGEVQWARCPQGYNFGGAELFLRPVDMARFGYLMLQDGQWEGRRVVPQDWVRESTRDQVEGLLDARPYGYWWWVGEDGWFYASGWGGQSVGVNRDLGVVLAMTAADPQSPRNLTVEYVLPWLEAGGTLSPDPAGAERLERIVRRLARPDPMPVPPMPPVAESITGRRYAMEWNGLGWEGFTLEFGDGDTCMLYLESVTGDYAFPAGLDGLYRITQTGGLGAMPSGNARANRGSWVDGSTFRLRSLELGNPVYAEYEFAFREDIVEVAVKMLPRGDSIALEGRAR